MSGSSSGLFSRFTSALSKWSGRPPIFSLALGLVVVWAISGPLFGFSSTWQLVINTVTSIITFLMVFMLQSSQNRDGKALQAKIDELILSSRARNMFVGIEKLEEDRLHEVCAMLPDQKQEDCGEAIDVPGAGLAGSR